jgi:chromosome segregation ATPase
LTNIYINHCSKIAKKSGESSRVTRDVTLTGALQLELEHVTRANTEVINEEQLRSHIQDINKELVALAQLPTTSRLNELLQEQQSVKNAKARISELLAEGNKVIEERNNLKQELLLTQQKLKTTEERVPVCTHGDLQAKITDLEQRLENRAPEGTENLRRELEETEEQLRICGEERNEYRDQVKRVLALAGNGGNGVGNRGYKGSAILRFSGTDRRALW